MPDSDLQSRTIRKTDHVFSAVSNPSFRDSQCLVIPRRHIVEAAELSSEEKLDVLTELGRLARLLDNGYGSGMMQKYQPSQPENGIKMNHLHFHVFPRVENEDELFPVPNPNRFDGFERLHADEVYKKAEALR